jgi:hypothetical protein
MNNTPIPNHTKHPILHPADTHTMRLAAELISVADQADDNANRYTNHPNDHGRLGSASRAYRTIATSLRWRAQMILDGTHPTDTDIPAQTTGIPDSITVEPMTATLRTNAGLETDPHRLAVVRSTTVGKFVAVLITTDNYDTAYQAARFYADQLGAQLLTASSYRPTIVGRDIADEVLSNPGNQPVAQVISR